MQYFIVMGQNTIINLLTSVFSDIQGFTANVHRSIFIVFIFVACFVFTSY